MNITLAGPWPRKLTEDEIDEIKARAMITVGDNLPSQLRGATLGLGDEFRSTYTLYCGTPDELAANRKKECGAVYASNLPACRLDKGHNCQHSSVIRWG